jgi:lysine 2,3-aminomutase
MDTVYGKVRLDDMKGYDAERNIAIFQREGHNIEYPDFPESLDEPGDLETMLWREK